MMLIVLVVWLTDERRLDLFPAGTFFRDPDHRDEGVYLTLPPHIFSVQVKSGAYYITGQRVPSSE